MESIPAERNTDGVDISLVRWFLSLTPSERLDVLQNYLNSLDQIRAQND
jgi:hypothetical protein